MTKTLTEQWREGTLPERYYYTKLNDDNGTIEINYCWDDGCFQDYCDNMVEEVLAPVPSYYEFLILSDFKKIEKDAIDNLVKIHTEKLEKKLAIATKALKEIAFEIGDVDSDCGYHYEISEKALKEMEGVK